ncbi:MAG: flagellar basal body P-ring formation chaperone FlgA [Alphaproteobacteria bacterium]|nr:flagellar basal body P-ring formation chaperone FlgA [Alphaproteobacteria bacterium]
MKDLLSLAFALAVCALLAAEALGADPAPAQPVTLNPTVTVEDARIRLGDLFAGIEHHGDAVVASAPAPGERVTLGAAWLARIAQAYKLGWRPMSSLERVTVLRSSQVLQGHRIEAMVRDQLAKEALNGDIDVELDQRPNEIHLPADAEDAAVLARFQFERRAMRFSGVLIAPANHPEGKRYPIGGRVYEMTSVPALGRRVMPGETVSERDLTWIRLRADRVGPNTVTDPGQIVGLSPKRVLQANRALTTAEIEAPVVVTKNSIVTVMLRHPGMLLTAKAKAASNGAMGETIRVVNTATNKTLDAVVIGPGTVAVGGSAPPRLAANQGF